jgi:sucrose phosphorylase
VSSKTNPDGSISPYELNVNYFDALLEPGEDPAGDLPVKRFLAAHAIMLSMIGVPGIYFHSLFGSRGWPDGVALSGHNRAINRQKLEHGELESQLAESGSRRARLFQGLSRLLALRAARPAFHPHGDQRVLEFGKEIFALLRTSPDGQERLVCLHNVTRRDQQVALDLASLGGGTALDLLGGERLPEGRSTIHLQPYQVYWIRFDG